MSARSSLVHDTLRDSGARHEDKVAVLCAGASYSYRELDALSDSLAVSLQRLGVQRGSRVIVCLGNRVETIVSFWAILKAGGVVSNVGYETTAAGLEYIIRDAEASVVITTAEKFSEMDEAVAALPFVHSFMFVGAAAAVAAASLYSEAIRPAGRKPLPSGVLELDLASIIYTSGSTGNPKGVMLTHRNMLSALSSLHGYLGYRSADTVLCSLPLSFDYGLYQMVMCVGAGATLLLEKEFTWPIFLIKSIKEHHVTIIPFVPTMLMLLHAYAGKKGLRFPGVRAVTNTGAALKESHIGMMKELFPAARIFSMYGLTECKRCTYLPPEDIHRKPNSIGIAIPNTELWLIDGSGERIAQANTVGQLVIRGGTVMAGYWKKPEATAEKLKPGLLPGEMVLHTGDYCSLDEDGYLYFQGRMDHVIKSRGMKVSPAEVESYLYTIAGIEAVVVVGANHDESGEALHAFVKLAPAAPLSVQDILGRCRADLEGYKVPQWFSIVESLPRTANGKFDVLKLREAAGRASMAAA